MEYEEPQTFYEPNKGSDGIIDTWDRQEVLDPRAQEPIEQQIDPIVKHTRLVKRRRGTPSEHARFKGAFAEFTVETSFPPTIVVHNGRDFCGRAIAMRGHRHWPRVGSIWASKERLDRYIKGRCKDYTKVKVEYEWLLCDGQRYDTELYEELYDILKSVYVPRSSHTSQIHDPIIREHDTRYNPHTSLYKSQRNEFGIRTPLAESMLKDRIFDFQSIIPTVRSYIKT